VVVALTKIATASVVMALAAVATERALHAVVPGGGLATRGVQVFGAISAGVLTLGLAARALRIAEFDEALASVLRRVRRRHSA
jgi:hypothetical protein